MNTATECIPQARTRPPAPPPAGDALRCSVLESPSQLDSLAGQWNALLADSPVNRIFLTWEWARAWLDAVFPDARLLIVAVHDGQGRLVGLAPFYQTTLKLASLVTYKCLRVIGDCDSGSDYPDIIAREGMGQSVLTGVMEFLMRRGHEWDCLWLPGTAGWTSGFDSLTRACHDLSLLRNRRDRTYMAIPLPGSYDGYLAMLGNKSRSNLRQLSRKLLGGQWSLEYCRRGEDLPPMLDCLFRLHRKRWQSEGEAGSFDSRPALERFYRHFAPVALERGWLRLAALTIRGEVQAVQYGYLYNGVFSAIQVGYNPEMNGAGNVLWDLVIKGCIEEGIREFDFMEGQAEYKRRLGAEARTGFDVFIARPSLKTLGLFRAGIWPTGRYLRPAGPNRIHSDPI